MIPDFDSEKVHLLNVHSLKSQKVKKKGNAPRLPEMACFSSVNIQLVRMSKAKSFKTIIESPWPSRPERKLAQFLYREKK